MDNHLCALILASLAYQLSHMCLYHLRSQSMMDGMILYILLPLVLKDGQQFLYHFHHHLLLRNLLNPLFLLLHMHYQKLSKPKNQSLAKENDLPILLTPTNLKHPHTQSLHIHNTLDMRMDTPLLKKCTQKHQQLKVKCLLRKIHRCPR
jgi:hypothetical protein